MLSDAYLEYKQAGSLKLRELFKEKEVIRLVGAHNPLTAKLVENSGFDGIWVSGFEISASYLVPDASILTMTQFLNVAQEISKVVSIPIVADCDSGFGGISNVINTVKNYENAGIAGIVIEDKKFPKLNSFAHGKHDLIPIERFKAKIKAAKHSQKTKDFMVFARVEALIAGLTVEEALIRANAYSEAGADGIFIHSKSRDASEIDAFCDRWDSETPLIICPTTYYPFVSALAKYNRIKMLIYANPVIRSSIKSIEKNLEILAKTNNLAEIENELSSMEHIFELQGMRDLLDNEKKFS